MTPTFDCLERIIALSGVDGPDIVEVSPPVRPEQPTDTEPDGIGESDDSDDFLWDHALDEVTMQTGTHERSMFYDEPPRYFEEGPLGSY